MEHIDLLIAVAESRQGKMLQAAEKYKQIKELQRGDCGLPVNILSKLGAALFALGRKVEAQKRTQVSTLDEECVGSEVNL